MNNHQCCLVVDYRDQCGRDCYQSTLAFGTDDVMKVVALLFEQAKANGFTITAITQVPGEWTISQLDEMAEGKRPRPADAIPLFADLEYLRSQAGAYREAGISHDRAQ